MMTMKFEGWYGMIIGPAIAIGYYLRVARKTGEPIDDTKLWMFIAMGVAAGLVVWFFDAMKPKPATTSAEAKSDDQQPQRRAA